MFEAARTGEIKILWISCTNPAHRSPTIARARSAAGARARRRAGRLPQHQTGRYAPCSPAAAGAKRRADDELGAPHLACGARCPPPGETRADWQIAVDLARRLAGRGSFPYRQPEEISTSHRETTRGRDLDITGLSYALLDERGPQNAVPEGAAEGKSGFTRMAHSPLPARARFVPTAPPAGGGGGWTRFSVPLRRDGCATNGTQ